MANQNKCERCGAASFKPVIGRDEDGAMKPTGEYQCVGCGLKFKDLDEWRRGPGSKGKTCKVPNERDNRGVRRGKGINE
jgi:DNA-directed RNA polymerase subunit RPC12/RpoP